MVGDCVGINAEAVVVGVISSTIIVEAIAMMGELMKLDSTVASQMYCPASENVRKVKNRVAIV